MKTKQQNSVISGVNYIVNVRQKTPQIAPAYTSTASGIHPIPWLAIIMV